MSRIADQVGRVLGGRYRLLAPIGTGASAHVYSADDVNLRRRVAVKVLHAALADDEAFLRRFRAEAHSVAALRHPNIMNVYDWGEDDGSPFLVLELLGGGSLRSLLDRGRRLTPSQALIVGLEAARALDYAHRRGLVHRDIKPANLLFDEEGRLCIADFGLARALAEAAWTEPAGAVLGTARYASPEQVQGSSVDGKADVYALALVLIEAVTGQVPFAADTTIATLMGRVGKDIVAPAAMGPLAAAVEAAGKADPAERIDAAELIQALDRAARSLPSPAPLPLAGAEPVDDSTVIDDLTVLPSTGSATGGSTAASATAAGATAAGSTAAGLTAAGSTTAGSAAAFEPTAPLRQPPRPLPGGPMPFDYDRHDDEVAALSSGPDRPGTNPPAADEGTRRRRPRWAVLLALVVVLGLVGGAAYAVGQARVPTHEVPKLTGLTLAAARTEAKADKLDVKESAARYDAVVPAGAIIEQQPPAKGKLKEGSAVKVVVSKGPQPVPVPDLTGLSIDQATAAFTPLGLSIDRAGVFSESAPKGTVIDWEHKGETLLPGSAVKVTVSDGPQPRTISDWRGKPFDDVLQKAFDSAGLKVTRKDVFDDTVPVGQVVSTSPAAGATAERDSTVIVNVSKGPDSVPVPDVSGMGVIEATAAMQRAGLTVSAVYGKPDKKVFVTDPSAGVKAKRGSSVNLYTR